ncbi:MAG: alpha-d-phosphohexomutase alpha/beta/alpha i/ii/iii [Verrucomicrobiales bacterium]|nr:alpha-d-phosphohexomutase alpha/beta/alpha i/ii/iii [Verrucomicrobiales bacterium]
MTNTDALGATLTEAVSAGKLLESSRANILELLAGSSNPAFRASVDELVAAGQWEELNDRFFKKLAFGTSGLRGRTIGKIVTAAERGNVREGERPDQPCTGTNALNFYNVTRATRGLCAFVLQYYAENGLSGKPSLVFSHDTRLFSREFAEFSAKVAAESGVDAWLFESFRPTPQLSFAVRQLNATGGVMITASHNPPHDNGYKVYFKDGDPIIDPVATGILNEVNAVQSDSFEPVPEGEQGKVTIIGKDLDEAYFERVKGVMLNPGLLEKARGLKIVYTPIHGTGGVHVPPLLKALGFNYLTVPEQDIPDGRFPTVSSPNPENAAALKMGMELADWEQADIVIATDPDCDRMGVAVRNAKGELQLITGNQIGSLMAWYRTKTMFELGWLNEANRRNAVLVKTFVTTRLQDAVAHQYGISVVNTLTGFKYIGGKLGKYERGLPEDIQARYRSLSDEESRAVRLEHSKFFVFGGEESYGYLGADWLRDKDGNGAVVMFAELAAYAASLGLTVPALLDEVYLEYGYFHEHSENLVFEGASGAAKMRKLMDSFAVHLPETLAGVKVTAALNFGGMEITDEEGDMVPKENMFLLTLEDGRRFVIRPSGTEPKIKVYFFGEHPPKAGGRLHAADLPKIKADTAAGLQVLWQEIQRDVAARLAE